MKKIFFNRHTNKFLISAGLLLSTLSYAQTETNVKLEPRENDGLYLVIDDTHEAVLSISQSAPFDIDVKMDLTESLCTDQYTQPSCIYKTRFASDILAFVWTKNPDNSRLGKELKYGYGDSIEQYDLEFNVFQTNNTNFIRSQVDSRFNTDKIICNDISWLGETIESNNLNHNLPSALKVKLWSSEGMSTNPETNINENRTTNMIENLVFDITKTSNNLYQFELKNIGHFITTNNFTNFPLLTGGNNSSIQISYYNDSNKICQASFSENLQSAVANIDLDSHHKENPNFTKMIYIKSAFVKSFLSQNSYIFDNKSLRFY